MSEGSGVNVHVCGISHNDLSLSLSLSLIVHMGEIILGQMHLVTRNHIS